jgi:hypothetical protein
MQVAADWLPVIASPQVYEEEAMKKKLPGLMV